MNLNTPVENIKGVGEKTAKLFEKLHIKSYNDLFEYYPRDYEVFEPVVSISEARDGEINAISGVIASVKGPIKAGRFTLVTAVIKSDFDVIELVYFNQPYIKKVLKVGAVSIFRGRIITKGTKRVIQSPKMYTKSEYDLLCNTPQPRYPLIKGLSSKTISKAIINALKDAEFDEEIFPDEWINKLGLITYKEAIYKLHIPSSLEDVKAARKRLSFQEFFYFILLLRKNKELSTALENNYPMVETAQTRRFVESLPFKLTTGQKNTWKDVLKDMTGPNVMNRLVQGDVGSGKTIVAILALLLAVTNGYQGAMMAPTEVLASQHMETINGYIKKYNLPIKPVLLVGSLKASEKREAYRQIESGEANVIIGTHALIQEKVNYKNLSLVVTDEQHRFGVRQREALSEKATNPHILVMSATPIPRTLAIILYGDLQLSAIHELPANRLPIKNCVVDTNYRNTAYKFIDKQVSLGKQAYVICPQVESNEENDLENVCDYTDTLRDALPNLRIEYLHGKMKPADKQTIMDRFSSGDIDVLVSTTVIEVGINVPNATVMLVENAERFGLAQLHQLRGRVGRGSDQSYCIFISSNKSEKTMQRLDILNKSNDGFEIASEDLKLRGPGELFGEMQSGDLAFRIADIYADSEMLESASLIVDNILNEDPKLKSEKYSKIKASMDTYCKNSDMLRTI